MCSILKYFAPSSSPKSYHFSKLNSGSQIFSPFPPVAKSSMWRGRVWMTRMWGGSSRTCFHSHRTGSSSSPSCHPMFFLTHSLESKKRPNLWFLYISLLWKLISTSNSISWLYHISRWSQDINVTSLRFRVTCQNGQVVHYTQRRYSLLPSLAAAV